MRLRSAGSRKLAIGNRQIYVVLRWVRLCGWEGGSLAALCSNGSGGDCDRLALFVQGLDLIVKEAGHAMPIADIGK